MCSSSTWPPVTVVVPEPLQPPACGSAFWFELVTVDFSIASFLYHNSPHKPGPPSKTSPHNFRLVVSHCTCPPLFSAAESSALRGLIDTSAAHCASCPVPLRLAGWAMSASDAKLHHTSTSLTPAGLSREEQRNEVRTLDPKP
jgi:hypothetical protein